ncbi:(2Fe-2S) ferredoxin domain-containing protein [Haloarculaceae archaeon H-GB11]|nr:(2Fe-2S) ferredoxin domain-containing protein [Haloarculaceae archaeon H-GB11]
MRHRTDEVLDGGFTDLVLVCTNTRDSEYAACDEVGGDEVFDAVKAWLRDRDIFWSDVYVAESTCVGLCSADGVAIVVQPRNEWYSDVTVDEVPELMADLFGTDGDDLGVGLDEPSLSQ